MTIPKVAKDAIRQQEVTIQNLTDECVKLRNQAKEQDPRIHPFLEQIAKSKSKFATEARDILGI